MGNQHLEALLAGRAEFNIEIRQTCDVYRKRAERAASQAGGRCRATRGYEDALASPHIDAVFVATPDHWHARMAVDALEAGKHVYLETPLGHTAEQALEVSRVAQAHQGRLRVQVGCESTSSELVDRVRACLQHQGAGQALMVSSTYTGEQPLSHPVEWENIACPRRAGIDWDRWLGHGYTCVGQPLAPQRVWDPRRYFQFRRYWDYSGGVGTDLFFHRLTLLLKATGLGYPERAIAAGGSWLGGRRGGQEEREVPDLYNVLLEYPNGSVVTLVGSGLNADPVPTQIACPGALITLNDPDWPTSAEFRPQQRRSGISTRARLTGQPVGRDEHRENFFRACRDARTELSCPANLGVRANVALVMALSAYREQKVSHWEASGQQPPDREVERYQE